MGDERGLRWNSVADTVFSQRGEKVEPAIDPNEMKASPSGFLRKDTEKVMVQLIEPGSLMELGQVLTMGAKKYEPDNWKRGVNDPEAHSRTMGSLLRHVYAYQTGEENDPESGLHHMAHVMCNAMFLFYFDRNGEKTCQSSTDDGSSRQE